MHIYTLRLLCDIHTYVDESVMIMSWMLYNCSWPGHMTCMFISGSSYIPERCNKVSFRFVICIKVGDMHGGISAVGAAATHVGAQYGMRATVRK